MTPLSYESQKDHRQRWHDSCYILRTYTDSADMIHVIFSEPTQTALTWFMLYSPNLHRQCWHDSCYILQTYTDSADMIHGIFPEHTQTALMCFMLYSPNLHTALTVLILYTPKIHTELWCSYLYCRLNYRLRWHDSCYILRTYTHSADMIHVIFSEPTQTALTWFMV
jgi:hypothetical protein